MGLQFVGFADELSRSIKHRSHRTDQAGLTPALRGTVYQEGSAKFRVAFHEGYWEAGTWHDEDVTFDPRLSLADSEAAAMAADMLADLHATRDRESEAIMKVVASAAVSELL